MKIAFDYIAGDSFLHRLNPLTKLLLALLVCISCFTAKSILFVVLVIALILFAAKTAGIFDVALALLKGLLKLSVILFVAQVFFIREGTVLLQLPANVYLTDQGILFSLLFVLKFMGATLPLALMLSITQMSELSGVLVDRLHIPYKYAFALTTAIRFIPVFAGEMSQIMEAQMARGVQFDTRNIFKKLGLIIPLCVPLLISSVKKIDSNAISAELRGFNCRTAGTSSRKFQLLPKDFMTLACSVALLAISIGTAYL